MLITRNTCCANLSPKCDIFTTTHAKNLRQHSALLLPALSETLKISERADFCVGYFNLRGWKQIDHLIDACQAVRSCCRVIVGMQRLPQDELRESLVSPQDLMALISKLHSG